MLKLAFVIPVSVVGVTTAAASDRLATARLEAVVQARSIAVARAFALVLAARAEERFEGSSIRGVLTSPDVEPAGRGRYQVRLDLELVQERDMTTAVTFLRLLGEGLLESLN